MTQIVRRGRMSFVVSLLLVCMGGRSAEALQPRPESSRFERLLVEDSTRAVDMTAAPLESLAVSIPVRAGWDQFRSAHGSEWAIYLDRRSGAPLYVEGSGIPFPAGPETTLETLEKAVRAFVAGNASLFLADDKELVFNQEGSGELVEDVWQIAFDRVVSGVPVAGGRYLFTIGHGRLISFGSPRWSRIDASPVPTIGPEEARARVASYMTLDALEAATAIKKATLELVPLLAPGSGVPYTGAVGSGYASALVWRVIASVPGDLGTWEAVVDAETGVIRSFQDINDYDHAKGGVYPLSADHVCPGGCEQPNFPMPFAKIYSGGTSQMTTSTGEFTCEPGGTISETALEGRFFKVGDGCGHLTETTTCGTDLNLRTSAGNNCAVPAGDSAGNTHATRSTFYHLNRVAEHARTWLPSLLWVSSVVEANVNRDDDACNAFFETIGGTLNFFQADLGCANTGELPGVTMHEWGHGLDRNDGGGPDSPNEAYADITSLLMTHSSCLGAGFQPGNCGGYGDPCLSCSGIRELDWDKRLRHTPATPANFVAGCRGGFGPCGKEAHCEGIVAGEAMWDLATRDLTAAGLTQASAWQIVDKLWFTSRLGSGGAAYNCSLPNSDGCNSAAWFAKLRAVDDDDGNLANGTPHAAAIFAAFDRHKIACGTALDASNQSSSSCPTIGATTLSAAVGNHTAALTWTPVPNANIYRVLRNELGCGAGSTIVATTTGTSRNETGLGNGVTEYYTVQAIGVNTACEGIVSNCQAVTPQPFAGAVTLNAPSYSCTGTIVVMVVDGNLGPTASVSLKSQLEPGGETVTVTQVSPGSDTYTGTIGLTSASPAPNGVLSVSNGNTITATYVDASDGGGGVNIPRLTTAVADCVGPVITKVQTTNITGTGAKITWTTNESASSLTHHGETPPPATPTSVPAPVPGHAVDVSGLSECTTYVYSVSSVDVVGNPTTDTAGGAYYTFTTGQSTEFSDISADNPNPIPDNSVVGASSTIVVTDARMVHDVNVRVEVEHTFDGDLTLSLTTPAGVSVTLSAARGGHENNFTGTVFDDEATNPIASGSAPFTGTFRPDTPLSAVDGTNAAGAWVFKVVDRQGLDIGSILSWTLELTYATTPCGPHAGFRSAARVADTCATGGPGSGNTDWDAGEHVRFSLNLANDGTLPLTRVSATVTSTTPGVVLADGTAAFPAIAPAGSADSLAPHFTAYLPPSLACGGRASFQVTIASDQGSWSGSFSQFVGRATNGTGRVLDEQFANGIPATWSIVDGGVGGGTASKWTANNPGVRTIPYPMLIPVVTVDSDAAGPLASQDEQLITPVMNLSTATTATLEFDQYFRWSPLGLSEVADVDVRSSLTGGAWLNVFRQQGASSPNPEHKPIDITHAAAGASNAQIRFRSYNGSNEQYWQLDNVTVDTSAPGSCAMPVCAAPTPTGAKPVADGISGTPMKASRANPSGTTIDLTWDVTTCASADHHLLYGDLAAVSSVTVLGASCDLGTTGSASWAGSPAGDLWFVVVGDDDGITEASWGDDVAGGPRGGTTASGLCGTTTRNNSGVCP